MASYQFTVPGDPVPKGRHRHRIVIPREWTELLDAVDLVYSEWTRSLSGRVDRDAMIQAMVLRLFPAREAVAGDKAKPIVVQHPDPKTKKYEKKVAQCAVAAGVQRLRGPVVISLSVYLHRPKRLMRAKDPDGPVPCDKRPDLSNLLKAIEDGLNGIAWKDDGQIYKFKDVDKLYHEKGGTPRVKVWVREAGTQVPIANPEPKPPKPKRQCKEPAALKQHGLFT